MLAGKLQPKSGKQPAAEPKESPTETVARKALEPVGVQLEGERKKKAGEVVHWSYGITWGALYGALHRLLPRTGRHFGLGFGLGLFLFGDVPGNLPSLPASTVLAGRSRLWPPDD